MAGTKRMFAQGLARRLLKIVYSHTGRTPSLVEEEAVDRLVDAIIDAAAEAAVAAAMEQLRQRGAVSDDEAMLQAFIQEHLPVDPSPAYTGDTIRATRRLSPQEEAAIEEENARQFWRRQSDRIRRSE